MAEDSVRPLAVLDGGQFRMELWPDCVRSIFAGGHEVTAAPNPGETMIETARHEFAHHLYTQVMHDQPSVCLRAVASGDGNRWTAERRAEEAFAFGSSQSIAEAFRKIRAAGYE